VLLAIANRAGEQRPWAIIIASAPCSPHVDSVNRPAVINPMWPTEE